MDLFWDSPKKPYANEILFIFIKSQSSIFVSNRCETLDAHSKAESILDSQKHMFL